MINITKEQFFDFVKSKKDKPGSITYATQHYLDFFDKYQQTGKKKNWNWAGFLPLWFFYRRMYAYGFCINSISRLLSRGSDKLVEHVGLSLWKDEIDFSLSIFSIVLFMCYADYVYLYYASNKISKGKKESGVNKPVLIIMSIIVFGICIYFLFLR